MSEPNDEKEVAPVGPVQYVKFVTKRAFGIELEVAPNLTINKLTELVKNYDPKKEVMSSRTYQQDHGNNYWHVKFDRSCGERQGEGGWEVASYVASGAEDLVKISDMGKVLKDGGARINDNCGYHIHAEVRDFKTNDAAALVAYWMKLENIIMEILPKNRRNNIYCRKLRDVKPVQARDLQSAESFWVRVRPMSMANEERRVALNMCNFALGSPHKRTAELRLPEGTLEPKDIKNWCRMFVHFVHSCKKRTFPGDITPVTTLKDALICLGLHSEDPFYILSSGLYETKTWFLERALKYTANKNLKTEAQEILSFIIPPTKETTADSKTVIVPGIGSLPAKQGPKKKKKETVPGLLDEADYWYAYDDSV